MKGKVIRYQGQSTNKTTWCVVVAGERLHVNATYISSTSNGPLTLGSVELGGCGCGENLVHLPRDVSAQVEQQLARRPKIRNW
ncbi:MAG: hypothetical protein RL292_95 [Candidatus Parcubacteria bacterium]|jgi:hypothetical protein